jgi:hypothetical protein
MSLAGLVFILLLAAGLGPTLLLNLLLPRLEPGGVVSCQEARAGFLFRSLSVTGLKISRPGPMGYDLALDRLRLDGLSPLNLLRLIRAFPAENIAFERLEASGLSWTPGPEQPWSFQLANLDLSGLQLPVLKQGLTGQAVWGWLAGCDRLNLERGFLTRAGRGALAIDAIRFDEGSDRAGDHFFRRRFQVKVDLPALAGDSPEPFWNDGRAILGDQFQADLLLALDYQPAAARVARAGASLNLPGLGRLELAGTLEGVAPVKPHHNMSQLLLSANDWQLEALKLVYDDEGLAGRLYRRLEETAWPGEPHNSSPDHLMAIVRPSLTDYPSLIPEIEAFIRQPGRLQIALNPEKPLPLIALVNSLTFMSLAKQNQYDIIKNLRLTLTANDRPPVLVTAAE